MSPPVRLALLGFTPFESEQIRAALGPEPLSGVAYVKAEDLASSSLVVVNADHEPSVAEILRQRRLASTVALGTTPCAGAAAQMGRVFHAKALRRTLDELAMATPPVSDAVRRVQEELARLGGRRFRRVPAPRRERASAAMPLIQGALATPRPTALVVDESDVMLRLLSAALGAQGWEWLLTRSAPEALDAVATLQPQSIFIRTGLDGLDGFHVCRMVGQSHRRSDRQPRVVLLLEQDTAVSRLRAQQAGADAVLTLPLDAQALKNLLQPAPATQPASKLPSRMDSALP